ncbi:MAG: thioredoxin family protein, partial [Pseudomonadota bacterium]
PTASGVPEIVLGGNVGEAAPASGNFGVSFGQAILFAFLGGMLLNLMPCVFPVLALKALGLVQHARQSTAHRAAIGGAYMAGVLASFAALTAVFLGLKASGVAVGWGFQLQEPVFVSAMAVLLFALGLSLSGVFDIGVGLTRLGGRGPNDGVPGSFATGVLATVVASPCTAPFMAVALGAALAASTETAAAVFAALALGFATPFTLLCVVPGLARVLPKPGVWMERLKQALAFPLYASAAWLVWVLAQLTGVDSLLTILGGFVMVALAAWLYGLSQRGAMPSHKVAAVFALICLAVGGAAFWNAVTAVPVLARDTAPPPRGEPFTPQRLTDLREAGNNVFLNVTAAWCISCKVNERVVLQTKRFDTLLTDYDVTYLEADWTRRDPDITRLMEEFGRAGVPLYVYYPSGGSPEILPQILTNAVVEDAFGGG